MHLPEFGPFHAFFTRADSDAPSYLKLLGLNPGPDSQRALDLVQATLADPKLQQWIDTLLSERDWRPHLPAALAHLLAPASLDHRSLWAAIDAGSWVAPQLAVAAFYADLEFDERVTARLDRFAHCGPAPAPAANQPKVASTLIAAARFSPSLVVEIARWERSDPIAQLVREDESWDRSGDIVFRWRSAALAAFEARGVPLVRPTSQ